MKVLLLSTTDRRTGASAAAFRLLQALDSTTSVEAKMLVGDKSTNSNLVIGPQSNIKKGIALLRPIIDSLPLSFYKQKKWYPFSPQWIFDGIRKKVSQINPDVINLHWVAGGFVRIETLAKLNKPIIISAHDIWTFTGGCHYDAGCGKFGEDCGACPQLSSVKEKDISRSVLERKKKAWEGLDITVVGGTSWVADMARKSSLYREGMIKNVEVIPLAIDTNIFRPIEKDIAREVLQIPKDKKVIFFGATFIDEPRKGMKYLQDSLNILNELIESSNLKTEDILLLIAGKGEISFLEKLPFKYKEVGYLNDDITLSLHYQSSDLFICPSIEDAGPTMIPESMLCGTPVVAFKTDGIPDFIEHKKNGYIGEHKNSKDLAEGMLWVLANENYSKVSEEAHSFSIKRHSYQEIAKKYNTLYKKVLDERK